MYQRAGVKLHHGWEPNAAREGFLLRDKQDEEAYCLTGKCSQDVEHCHTKRAPVASIDPAAGPSSPSKS